MEVVKTPIMTRRDFEVARFLAPGRRGSWPQEAVNAEGAGAIPTLFHDEAAGVYFGVDRFKYSLAECMEVGGDKCTAEKKVRINKRKAPGADRAAKNPAFASNTQFQYFVVASIRSNASGRSAKLFLKHLRQLRDGLQYVHSMNCAIGNVSAHNTHVTYEGEVRITDFSATKFGGTYADRAADRAAYNKIVWQALGSLMDNQGTQAAFLQYMSTIEARGEKASADLRTAFKYSLIVAASYAKLSTVWELLELIFDK